MTTILTHRAMSFRSMTAVFMVIFSCSLLSACATTQPDETRDDSAVPQAPPLRLTSSITKTPSRSAAPLPASTTNNILTAETAVKASADRGPDPSRNVFFAMGSAEISDGARSTLRKIAAMLNANHRNAVTLVGSTDDLGSREYCIAISSKRTDAVEAELLKLGVHPSQIRKHPRGYAAASPKKCASEACRHNKRRVEIRFVE